jgi:uridine phosphorylase
MKSEMGKHPLLVMDVDGREVAVYQPGISAAFAAAMLEEVIAHGCRKFIACGAAGVLDRSIDAGHIIVPRAAVRDEGASYHYMPPSRDVEASPEGVAAIERVLTSHGRPYTIGKTWTTDGIYSGDTGQGRTAQVRGLHHRRDGGRRVLRGGSLQGRHVRPDALRRGRRQR